MQETSGTEPNLEGEIEGVEPVIQVKMEDDGLSVSSVADLEARIRLLYFKVTVLNGTSTLPKLVFVLWHIYDPI